MNKSRIIGFTHIMYLYLAFKDYIRFNKSFNTLSPFIRLRAHICLRSYICIHYERMNKDGQMMWVVT